MAAPRSSCRSVRLQWGLSNDVAADGDSATIEVTRSDADAQSATVDYGSLGTMTATLSRGAWAINTWMDGNNGSYGEIVVNGSLSCYTRSGLS